MTRAPQAAAQFARIAAGQEMRPSRLPLTFARVPRGAGLGMPAKAIGTAVGRAVSEREMGRLLLFIIIIGAALAGVWFYAPGGKDMLLGAKDKAMSYMPGKAEEATAEDIVVEDIVVEEVDEAPMDDMGAEEEAPAEEPQE